MTGGWLVDKSVAARMSQPHVAGVLSELFGQLYVCPMGELEQLFSARSAGQYDDEQERIRRTYLRVEAPNDLLDRALALQRDLAHHHGMWHRIPIRDLLIAETALFHDLGILHVDGDYDRICEVRPLVTRRPG